jgi:hypothetical protein
LINLINTAEKIETSNGAISLSKKLLEVIGNAN